MFLGLIRKELRERFNVTVTEVVHDTINGRVTFNKMIT